MTATLRETAGLRFTVVDEYGDVWTQIAADGRGNLAVECDTGERWESREFTIDSICSFVDGATGELWESRQPGSEFTDTAGLRHVATMVDSAGSIRWRKAR